MGHTRDVLAWGSSMMPMPATEPPAWRSPEPPKPSEAPSQRRGQRRARSGGIMRPPALRRMSGRPTVLSFPFRLAGRPSSSPHFVLEGTAVVGGLVLAVVAVVASLLPLVASFAVASWNATITNTNAIITVEVRAARIAPEKFSLRLSASARIDFRGDTFPADPSMSCLETSSTTPSGDKCPLALYCSHSSQSCSVLGVW